MRLDVGLRALLEGAALCLGDLCGLTLVIADLDRVATLGKLPSTALRHLPRLVEAYGRKLAEAHVSRPAAEGEAEDPRLRCARDLCPPRIARGLGLGWTGCACNGCRQVHRFRNDAGEARALRARALGRITLLWQLPA
jgi:hypothetical protein